jgi:uncharacterized protein YjbI with pentapeptide repeats
VAFEEGEPVPHWPSMSLNLTGATLVNFSLMRSEVKGAIFSRAIFHGPSYFYEFAATGRAHFQGANFLDSANFGRAHFPHVTNFWEAHFHEFADFSNAVFDGQAHFKEAIFDKGINFSARVRVRYADDEELSSWPSGCQLAVIDDTWVTLSRRDQGFFD